MNLLIVGGGKGSWEIRGLQLGQALGARVSAAPTRSDWEWADLCVLVKRALSPYASVAQSFGVPIVWDALDFWRQPAEHIGNRDSMIALARAYIDHLTPALVVGATQAMADDLGGVCLTHHSWPGLEPAEPSQEIGTVAYQGNASYLGAWLGHVSRACSARGWRFVVNPADLREADIIVALRDGPWDGWVCRQWKSGVKVVNAIAAGRPVITQDIAAARELSAPGSIVETPSDLDVALESWRPLDARRAAADRCRELAPLYTLPAVAARYRAILQDVTARTPCTVA